MLINDLQQHLVLLLLLLLLMTPIVCQSLQHLSHRCVSTRLHAHTSTRRHLHARTHPFIWT